MIELNTTPQQIKPNSIFELLATKYIFFSDPGHGWLKVPITHLEAVEIVSSISGYSYKHGKDAYLEEDSDAPKFMDAWKHYTGKEFTRDQIEEVYQENTPIRGYSHFTGRTVYAAAERI